MKSKTIAESGLLIALTLVILYSASYIPINTMTLLTISSCLIPISLIRNNMKASILVYACSSILALILVPIKISLLYVIFFGIYGIVKHYIEKLNKIPLEIIIKLTFFNIMLAIGFFLFKTILFDVSNLAYSIWILIAVAQVVFLIYDYALTLLISIYLSKIHKNL